MKEWGIFMKDMLVKELNKNYNEMRKDVKDLVNYICKVKNLKKTNINAEKNKCGIFISVDNQKYLINIKSGNGCSCPNTFTAEYFVNYLKRNCNIDKRIENSIKRFIYSDGTIDGSSSIQLSNAEYKKYFAEELREIQQFFSNDDINKKIIRLFNCRTKDDTNIDFFVRTDVTGKIISYCSAEDLVENIHRKQDSSRSILTLGGLNLQPLSRGKTDNKKGKIQAKYSGNCSMYIRTN